MKTLSNYVLPVIVPIIALVVLMFAFVVYAQSTQAATYAYVDAAGDVKSVTANDWQTAIATAPNIHMRSGVMLLESADDYQVVGDKVIVR
ncbi:MAG: hypothetical protein V4606_03765 [Patescibacteria group bacterium]